MKRKRLSCFRSCFTLFFALILILVLCVPAAAYPASFTEHRNRFTPFHMALGGHVFEYDSETWEQIEGHYFEVPLPNIDYEYAGERTFSSDSLLFLDNSSVTVTTSQFMMANYMTPSSFDSKIDFQIALSTYGSNITQFADGWFDVIFQNGYLTPDYGLFNRGDGIIFASYGSDYYDMPENDIDGEFYVGNNPYETYESSYVGGTFLSYYAILYHSDYDFLANLPSDVNPELWTSIYDSFSDSDFYHLTASEIEDLQFLFSWVGPIFGRFGVNVDPIEEDGYHFNFLYLLTDHVDVENAYEKVVQITIDSGKTGFERMTHWLGSAVSGFLSVEIMPSFSIGGLVVIVIAFSLVLWWLKVFAGG